MDASPTKTLALAVASNSVDAATVVHRRQPVAEDAGPTSCIHDLDLPETLALPLRFGSPKRTLPQTIGAYSILREVGSGGMGVVYEGFDPRLKRRAAIKMIRSGVGVVDDNIRRFQTEAEAVAQTHHPNIVQIYEVGWHDDQPFVALEYLNGGSLYAKASNKPQPPREAAATVKTLADAVQHAHTSGVIHRDLKPANVLFSNDGVAKITDFGAARLTLTTASSNQPGSAVTQVGEVIGTPQYMAPEQARGTPDSITPAVDVYALGAMLYHLLTGRPPHDGPDAYDVLTSVLKNDPVPPRRLVPNIPRDLETICLKALEKHPLNRYRSAAAFSEDLQRYLNGESIAAKPDPGVVRLWKKAKRSPVIAGLIAGIVIVALAGLAGVLWQFNEAVVAAKKADDEAAIANREKAAAVAARNDAVAANNHQEWALYRSQVSEIALMLESGDIRKGLGNLENSAKIPEGKTDRRHWEWHHLNRLGSNHLWRTELGIPGEEAGSVWTHRFALSPDGKTLAISAGNPYRTSGFDQFVSANLYFVDVASGAITHAWKEYSPEAAVAMVWRPDNTIVVNTPRAGVRVYDAASGKILRTIETLAHERIYASNPASQLSPDGRYAYLCTEQTRVALFDTSTGETLRTYDFPEAISHLPHPSQSGSQWYMIVVDGVSTHVIDPRTGDHVLVMPDTQALYFACDPAGRRMAVLHHGGHNVPGRLDVWDLTLKRRLWSQPRPWMTDGCQIKFHPDGGEFAEMFNHGDCLRLMETETGRLKYELRGHTNRILDFDYSPDGRQIASASNDGSVRVWNRNAAAADCRLRAHLTGARTVLWDPNGWRLFSGGMDANTIAWDLTRERCDGSNLPRMAQQGLTRGGAFAGGLWVGPDGLTRYLDMTESSMILFDAATLTPRGRVEFEGMHVRAEKTASDFALSADARLLFGPCTQGPEADLHPRLWDAATGKILKYLPGVTGIRPRIIAAALNADGSRAAASLIDFVDNQPQRQFLIWDTVKNEVLHREVPQGVTYPALAFDPKQPRLLMGIGSLDSEHNGVLALDLNTFEKRVILPFGRSTLIRCLAFSPDGKHVAGVDTMADASGMWAFAFDADRPATGWIKNASGPATGVAFSPDSRRVAVARFDDQMTLFETDTGAETLHKVVHTHRLGDYAYPARVAFTPDSRTLIMNQANGNLSVWRTDDWTAKPEQQRRERLHEANTAAYAYHLRGAEALKSNPDSVGFRFHRDWLDKLTPPNNFVKSEWSKLKAGLK